MLSADRDGELGHALSFAGFFGARLEACSSMLSAVYRRGSPA